MTDHGHTPPTEAELDLWEREPNVAMWEDVQKLVREVRRLRADSERPMTAREYELFQARMREWATPHDATAGAHKPEHFHLGEGWYFWRAINGIVRIEKRADGTDGAPVVAEATIPAEAWASIVSHVCLSGEDARSYAAALKFHAGIDAARQEPTP